MVKTIIDGTEQSTSGISIGFYARNAGKAWISHGDNVITLQNAHSSTDYYTQCTIRLPLMGSITARGGNNTYNLSVSILPLTGSRIRARIHGGLAVSSGGFTNLAESLGTTQRFDDIANTQTNRTSITTTRHKLGSFSINGYGFTVAGRHMAGDSYTAYQVERFDDVSNAHTARKNDIEKEYPAGYSLNGFGFTSCGWNTSPQISGVTERFDDVANTHTARKDATPKYYPTGYGLNGYGFTSCGMDSQLNYAGTTERFDDTANSHTVRASATARYGLAGYSAGGYGFTSCGLGVSVTERFDDIANTHTSRLAATSRGNLTGFSGNGCGFTSCGGNNGAEVGTTERFDDIANTQTARTSATVRNQLTGYSLNEYFVDYLTI